MKFLIEVPNELHAQLEIIKSTRSLRTGERVFLKDLYLEAIRAGISALKEKNLKEGLSDGGES